jgi:N-hydroxyarylamine O-acetyltransferase
MDFDLDRYFDRIRYGGPTRVDYETLAALVLAHMSAIAFENIDVLLGRGIRLDLEGLVAKLVTARRGGYCFEHGTLFAAALEALGFSPVRHLARVVVVLPRTVAPRNHMMLSVEVPEGTFVVDPGFGALAARVPIPLAHRREATIDRETHWLEQDGHEWTLRMRGPDRIVDCWMSRFEPENALDFTVSNHWTATHPESPFVNRVMLRALTPDGRVSVHNRDLTITRGGIAESSQLEDRRALRAMLERYFGFDLPEVETMRVPMIPEWS